MDRAVISPKGHRAELAMSLQQQRLAYWRKKGGLSSQFGILPFFGIVSWLIANVRLWKRPVRTGRRRTYASDLATPIGVMNKAVGRSADEVRRGSEISLIDCSCGKMAFGELRFRAVDYGDSLALNDDLQAFLTDWSDSEVNKCAVFSLPDGVGRILQGRPKRFPNSTRVLSIASGIRAMEVAASHAVSPSCNNLVVRIAAHAIVSLGRDRDIRAPQWFFPPISHTCSAYDVRIVVVPNSNFVDVAHLFAHPDPMGAPIYMVSYQGHLRRIMPTTYANPDE